MHFQHHTIEKHEWIMNMQFTTSTCCGGVKKRLSVGGKHPNWLVTLTRRTNQRWLFGTFMDKAQKKKKSGTIRTVKKKYMYS